MKKLKLFGLPIVAVLILVLPLVTTDPSVLSIAIYTLLYATAVTGWNLFSGYSGYVSLGYASFTGLGGYTMAIISDRWQIPGGYTAFLLLPLAGLVACLFSIPMGWVALRTRRVTFVVVTIAFMFVLQLLVLNFSGFTGGSSGITFPVSDWSGDFYNIPYYYVSFILLIAAIVVSWWIRNSKYGLGLLAIRDDEDRAAGLGVNTWAFKLTAYMISAFFGGMVGAMFAFYSGSIFPSSAFDPNVNIAVALMAFLGGVGTLAGPVLGAFLLEPFQQYLTILYGSVGLNLIILGALMLGVILLLPEGILTTLPKIWQKRKALRGDPSSASPVVEQNEVVLAEQGGGETR